MLLAVTPNWQLISTLSLQENSISSHLNNFPFLHFPLSNGWRTFFSSFHHTFPPLLSIIKIFHFPSIRELSSSSSFWLWDPSHVIEISPSSRHGITPKAIAPFSQRLRERRGSLFYAKPNYKRLILFFRFSSLNFLNEFSLFEGREGRGWLVDVHCGFVSTIFFN